MVLVVLQGQDLIRVCCDSKEGADSVDDSPDHHVDSTRCEREIWFAIWAEHTIPEGLSTISTQQLAIRTGR